MPDAPEAPEPAPEVTLVIPALNEGEVVRGTVEQARTVIQSAGFRLEVVVVDDGSNDDTAARAREAGAVVVSHAERRGYGAAIRTGVGIARSELIAIIDADGTYPIERFPDLLALARQSDMVVGARRGLASAEPWYRRLAKRILNRIAAGLSRRPIPDLNSGMRVFRRDQFQRFEHLVPNGFSLTTTLTLAMLAEDLRVQFVPIDYAKRVGHSKIRPIADTIAFLQLVVRLTVLFTPLNIFLPPAYALIAIGLIKLPIDFIRLKTSIATSTAIVLFLGFQLLVLGALADLLVTKVRGLELAMRPRAGRAQHATPTPTPTENRELNGGDRSVS